MRVHYFQVTQLKIDSIALKKGALLNFKWVEGQRAD